MSKLSDIKRHIKKGESESVEFKETFHRELLESLCAFANIKGGTVIIGVDDDGKIKGAQVGRHSLKDWANQIHQGIGIHPSINTIRFRGKTIVTVTVSESKIKPVLFNGRSFQRVGSTTRHMTMEKLTRLILESTGLTWDEVTEDRATWKDIDRARVKEFIRLTNETGRQRVASNIATEDLFEKLKIVKKGKLTRAAILLFGKEPRKFYPLAMVKVGRFRDETLIVDDREIEGNLFQQVEGVMGYFREKLETRFEMTGQPQRNVIWEYPLAALREGIINALCHRDYLINGHSQIRIYDDHVFILNVGHLPEGLSIENLKTSHPSIPRNHLIAKIFYFAGLIEQWGSGIGKMIQESIEAGLQAPVFEEGAGFSVTFKKGTAQVPHKHRTGTAQGKKQAAFTTAESKLLAGCKIPRNINEMMRILGLTHRVHFMRSYLHPLLKKKLLSMTDPESPSSPKQKYVTTKKGGSFLRKL